MKCPFTKEICLKDKCELWSELLINDKKVGRCVLAWNAILLIEIRTAIENISKPKLK